MVVIFLLIVNIFPSCRGEETCWCLLGDNLITGSSTRGLVGLVGLTIQVIGGRGGKMSPQKSQRVPLLDNRNFLGKLFS